KASQSTPCTMQASSTVSPREEGQPRQCMPMAMKRGAVWGAMSRISPMMVCFSIFAIITFSILLVDDRFAGSQPGEEGGRRGHGLEVYLGHLARVKELGCLGVDGQPRQHGDGVGEGNLIELALAEDLVGLAAVG